MEMLIVLVVIAMFSAISHPMFNKPFQKVRIKGVAQKVVNDFNHHLMYIAQEDIQKIFIAHVPEDFIVDGPFIKCYPDGTFESNTITISDDNYKINIHFDCLIRTGRIGEVYNVR